LSQIPGGGEVDGDPGVQLNGSSHPEQLTQGDGTSIAAMDGLRERPQTGQFACVDCRVLAHGDTTPVSTS
jgi:hypothetical protein